jgi:hypothetical protein
MWVSVLVAVAVAGKGAPKPAKGEPKPAAAAAIPAVARWVDGRIEVSGYDTAVGCDDAPEGYPTRRLALAPTEDAAGWAVTEVEVSGAASGIWYTDAERRVKGLEALVTGQGTLSFAPVTVELDDGAKVEVSAVAAKWCGAPLASALARPSDDGSIDLHLFAAGSLHACEDGSWGDTIVTVAPYAKFDGQGWGVRSVSETESGAADDFWLEGAQERPAKLTVAAGMLEASFAALPPMGSESGPSERKGTVTGPVKAAWCGEAAPGEVGAAAPGAAGAWMRVGTRWFEVQGARLRKKEGLELSTLPLSCDRGENYMKDALNMNLQVDGKGLTFWSVSGNLFSPPYSWNRSDEKPPVPAPRLDADTVTLASVLDSMEVKGTTPLVRCD